MISAARPDAMTIVHSAVPVPLSGSTPNASIQSGTIAVIAAPTANTPASNASSFHQDFRLPSTKLPFPGVEFPGGLRAGISAPARASRGPHARSELCQVVLEISLLALT